MTNDNENYLKPTSPAVLLWTDGPQIFLASDIAPGRRFLLLTLDIGVFAAVPFGPDRRREELMEADGTTIDHAKLLREYKDRPAMIMSWENGSTVWKRGETRKLTDEELPSTRLVNSLH